MLPQVPTYLTCYFFGSARSFKICCSIPRCNASYYAQREGDQQEETDYDEDGRRRESCRWPIAPSDWIEESEDQGQGGGEHKSCCVCWGGAYSGVFLMHQVRRTYLPTYLITCSDNVPGPILSSELAIKSGRDKAIDKGSQDIAQNQGSHDGPCVEGRETVMEHCILTKRGKQNLDLPLLVGRKTPVRAQVRMTNVVTQSYRRKGDKPVSGTGTTTRQCNACILAYLHPTPHHRRKKIDVAGEAEDIPMDKLPSTFFLHNVILYVEIHVWGQARSIFAGSCRHVLFSDLPHPSPYNERNHSWGLSWG